MLKKKIIVNFIHHSCFTIETDKTFFIIDYFKGDLPKPKKDKETIFLVSHSHKDHFSKEIFNYGNFNDNIYILSDDLRKLSKEDKIIYLKDEENDSLLEKKKIFSPTNVFCMKVNEKLSYHNIDFYTFGSTDRGVSFLVELPFMTFFHAGDLNNWVWEEDTDIEREKMKRDFQREINKINTKVDVSFFPIDPRLKENYDLGVSYFIDRISPDYLFPMHLWNDLEFSKKFKEDYKNSYTNIFEIKEDGQSFEIEIEL
ncbi:MAG: MBL fold metallo-hydrolase [Lagierella massiliensis]|nr:MBL fold metallo-hydrolase [Lagierella massiliensis]